MAPFKYFKRTSKRTKGHRETLSANDINKANESIAKALEVKGRRKYNTYTPGQRACSSSPISGVQVSWYTW